MPEFPDASKPPVEGQKQKHIERVVAGEVSARKPPLSRRFGRMFVQDDAQSVGSYILFEVFLPAAKDTISDIVSMGIDRMLFGDSRSASTRPSRHHTSSGRYGHVDYSGISSGRNAPTTARPALSPQARAHHDFREIVIPTRAGAIAVINQMGAVLEEYNVISVADFYEMVGHPPTFIDNKYGWYDLPYANIRRAGRGGGFVLDIPAPVQLD